MPATYRGNSNMFDHLIGRTLYRPRDIIQFMNEALTSSVGKASITAGDIDAAEGEYSKQRLAALIDEWSGEHPCVEEAFELFRGGFSQFRWTDVGGKRLEDLCIQATVHNDALGIAAKKVVGDNSDLTDFLRTLLVVLYRTGFLSVRPAVSTSVQSAYLSGFILNEGDVSDEIRFLIAPMVWRALNIRKGAIKGVAETD